MGMQAPATRNTEGLMLRDPNGNFETWRTIEPHAPA